MHLSSKLNTKRSKQNVLHYKNGNHNNQDISYINALALIQLLVVKVMHDSKTLLVQKNLFVQLLA